MEKLTLPKIKYFQIALVAMAVFLVAVMGIVTFVAQTRVHGRVALDAGQVQMLRQKASEAKAE